jgi:cytochrome oxidase Cu insertion factor (SCO1/SenC/PrrC family)
MQGVWLIAFIVQWVMLLILTLLVAGILRHLAAVQERWDLAAPPISTYEINQSIAEFELRDATGTKVQSRDLLHQSNGAVILFISTTCSSCSTILAQVSELIARRDVSLTKTIVVITLGAAGSLASLLDEYPSLVNSQVVTTLADEEGITLRQFGIVSVPIGLAVDREGRLVTQTLNPHVANWLYTVLGTTPPTEPVMQGVTTIIKPAAYLERKG